MDITAITSAFGALKAAKDLGTALVELRDFNQLTAVVSELNRKILEAQEGLFLAQAKMLELQSEHLQALEKLRNLEKRAEDRARYALVELDGGAFTYRLKVAQEGKDGAVVDPDEPVHHICQPCMDIRGHKSVLMKGTDTFAISLNCPSCGAKFRTGESVQF